MSRQTTQRAAARVLVGLTKIDTLPRLDWKVRPDDGAGLKAQPWGDSDDDRRQAMQAWAEHLGVPVTTTTYDRYVNVQVDGWIDGVPIHIFTHTAVTYAYVQVAATAEVAR